MKTLKGRKGKAATPSASATVADLAATPDGYVAKESQMEKTDAGFWRLKEEFQGKINPFEKIKLKGEFDVVTEGTYLELAAAAKEVGFEAYDKSLDKDGKDTIDVRLKWLGLFHRRKTNYGTFMMRLKLPNGTVNSKQVRALAEIIEPYGEGGVADITTRQNFQIRGVRLEDLPEILEKLKSVDLLTVQSGMDNVRNAVGNPLAGIDPEEIIDTRPYLDVINERLVQGGKGNKNISNLPRKWNVALIGSHDLFEHPHINDLAYMPAMKGGRMGFNLLVGGFFSGKRCSEAIPMGAWCPEEYVADVFEAILVTFRDLGSRVKRDESRMMYLIEALGMEAFTAEVNMRLADLGAPALEAAAAEDMTDSSRPRRSYYGINKQKQEGLNWLGLRVPVGRMLPGDMKEVARLAEEYGSGELRLTVEENVIIPNIPDDKVEAILAEPLLKTYVPNPGPIMSGLVSCTGSQFCGLAIVETKANGVKLAKELEATMNIPNEVRMHWTGCPNTCGQVQVADVGFMGAMAKDAAGKPTPGVNVFLGGRIGHDSHLGEQITDKPVAIEGDLLPFVQNLLVEKFGASML
mmetsp:Transcript_29303/g.93756  ORF Transcript_29303/g.93756 Transcript_29303/m.93756 type:complete len:577 (+) Transcript_29303:379-2109(+)